MCPLKLINFTKQLEAYLPDKLVVVFSLLFVSIYIKVSGANPYATVSSLASFHAAPPFQYRFILPFLLSFIVPTEHLDAKNLHFTIALPLVIGIFIQQKKYIEKLLPSTDNSYGLYNLTTPVLFIILLLHYCAPRALNSYYIYDLPSILFYFFTFNILTSNKPVSPISFVVIFIGLLNRETLIIAMLHAVAYDYIKEPKRLIPTVKSISWLLVFFVGYRLLINNYLDMRIGDSAFFYEGGNLRLIHNLMALGSDSNYRVQFLMLGGGVILWLPSLYKKLPPILKGICISSIPALGLLFFTGNFVELRIYNELVPIFALLLQLFCFNVKPHTSVPSLRR